MTVAPEALLLSHFLGALAYRTQKSLRDAPAEFAEFRIVEGARTPRQLLQHMTSVLGYARTFFLGGEYTAPPLADMASEVNQFHAMLHDVNELLLSGAMLHGTTYERLLQGPLADAMTHVGQIALLRRVQGTPVPPENFLKADISAANVSSDQPPPAAYGRRDGQWDGAWCVTHTLLECVSRKSQHPKNR